MDPSYGGVGGLFYTPPPIFKPLWSSQKDIIFGNPFRVANLFVSWTLTPVRSQLLPPLQSILCRNRKKRYLRSNEPSSPSRQMATIHPQIHFIGIFDTFLITITWVLEFSHFGTFQPAQSLLRRFNRVVAETFILKNSPRKLQKCFSFPRRKKNTQEK